MVRSASLFSQLLKQTPRPLFAELVIKHQADVKIVQGLHFTGGSILVIDRAYIDYTMFGRWCDEEVYFVTRLKNNAAYYKVIEREPPKKRNILFPNPFWTGHMEQHLTLI